MKSPEDRPPADSTRPPGPPELDEATLRRVLNGLRARGVFRAPAATPPQRPPSAGQGAGPGWARLAAWWDRHAVPATLAVAVCTSLFLTTHPPAPADVAGFHGLPAAAVPLAGPPEPTQTVLSPQPDADALRLLSLLASQGVTAELRPEGGDRIVQADVPTATHQRLADVLALEGLAAPPGGALVVRFAARAS